MNAPLYPFSDMTPSAVRQWRENGTLPSREEITGSDEHANGILALLAQEESQVDAAAKSAFGDVASDTPLVCGLCGPSAGTTKATIADGTVNVFCATHGCGCWLGEAKQ